jgi:hypothetical protein
LVEECRRHLFSGAREQVNTLAATLSSSPTVQTVTFNYPLRQITEGAVIEVDLELMLVLATNVTNNSATVLRGQLGSASASHSSDAVVTVNPKFPRFGIFSAINEELGALSSEGLFQVKTVDLTYNPAIDGYDMTSVTDLLDIYSVRYSIPGPNLRWPEIRSYQLKRNMPTTDFASGIALVLDEGGYPGRTVRVSYLAPFSPLTALTDNVVTTSGLHTEAHDIPPLGAAARLVMPRDVKRGFTETQGDTRRAEEVPPGASMASGRGLLALRDRRVQQEIARLRRFFPARLVI